MLSIRKLQFALIILTILVFFIVLFFSDIENKQNETSLNFAQNTNNSSNYYTRQHSSSSSPQTNYTRQNYTSTQATTYPIVTTSILQSILQKSPEINKLPDSAKIILQFHNEKNQYIGYKFFIGGKGVVYSYTGQAYDMWITLNINELFKLQASTNVCADLKSIVTAGNAWVIEQTKNPFTLMKYLGIKNCVK
jgi:hypothetical protein